MPIRNTDRTAGAMLSGEVAKRYGHAGLPDDTIEVKLTGTAGQSFGAWLARGVTLELEGEANDYVGKGLSGGTHHRPSAGRIAASCRRRSIIVGNTVLYGAIAGECYFRGVAGERFAVRNSGAVAVVEGIGDHGCEYMTGGVVVVLGQTGRNFAAGMSGGIAYVLDEDGSFAARCNLAMVELEPVPEEEDLIARATITRPATSKTHGRVDVMSRHDALRRRAAACSSSRNHGKLHRLRRAPTTILAELGRLPAEVPQGHAGRIPPRAANEMQSEAEAGRACGIHARAGELRRHGQGHRLPRDRSAGPALRAGRRPHPALARVRAAARRRRRRATRARAAWIAAFRFVTPAARSTTRSPTGTTSSIAATGTRRSRNLHSTNNFPEFTGRVCPAPCEASCTLNLDDSPVTIKTIECAIVDRAWAEGWVEAGAAGGQDRQEGRRRRLGPGRPRLRAAARPRRPRRARLREERQGRRPAALRHPRLQDGEAPHRPPHRADGGRGRRLPLRRHVGVDMPMSTSSSPSHDAVVLAGGAEKPRDLPIPGRELDGVHFAMDFLPQQNRRVAGEPAGDVEPILASGKHVVVIGGGDTGSDCIGTSIRQGALSVTQLEIMPRAAGEGGQGADLAGLAAEAAHLVEPRGGRRARLRRADHAASPARTAA